MLTITTKDTFKAKTLIRRIECKGHAEGEDHTSICAAASMLMQALALFLARRYSYGMDAQLEPGDSFVECEADVADRVVATAFEVAYEGFISLQNRYPKQVSVQ